MNGGSHILLEAFSNFEMCKVVRNRALPAHVRVARRYAPGTG